MMTRPIDRPGRSGRRRRFQIGSTLASLVIAWLAPTVSQAAGSSQRLTQLESRLVERLQAERSRRALSPMHRVDLLDDAAATEARRLAALPQRQRMRADVPIDVVVREAGVRRYRVASAHFDFQRGYRDPLAQALKSWRGYTPSWEKLLAPDVDGLGLAIARDAEGWIVLVAVMVEGFEFEVDADVLVDQVIAKVNAERVAAGLPPMLAISELNRVARAHSLDMVARDFFDHVSPEGSSLAERCERAGVRYRRIGENLHRSRGFRDPAERARQGWMESEGHRKNILTPWFRETGVGVAVASDGTIFITQVFRQPASER